MSRTPQDGQPFYCVKCKAGFGEYIACERPDCKLESQESAEVRMLLVKAAKQAMPRDAMPRPMAGHPTKIWT